MAVATVPEVVPTTVSTDEGKGHTYKFNVAMSCGGCSGAIERVLRNMEGLKSFDVYLDDQTVTVNTLDKSPSYDTIYQTIAKTGKKIRSGERDGQEVPLPEHVVA